MRLYHFVFDFNKIQLFLRLQKSKIKTKIQRWLQKMFSKRL